MISNAESGHHGQTQWLSCVGLRGRWTVGSVAEHIWSLRRRPDIGDAEVMWPHELIERFDESELVGQFRLSEAAIATPTGWREEAIGSWHLVYDRALPVMHITSEGDPVGWILGQPIVETGALLTADFEVGSRSRTVGTDLVESLLDEFAGRFAAIIVGLDVPRLYLDGAGSIGVMFSADQRIAASSAFLIPYAEAGDDRLAFARGRGPFEYDPHLHFGLTVRMSVDWLPPDHYLDLSTWRAVRHWPRAPIVFTTDIGEVIEFVTERIRRNIRAVVETGRTQMSLTAGMDTRLMLACARGLISDIEFVTYEIPDHDGRIDVAVARHIARTMKIRHRVIHRRPATDRDVERLLYRTGGMAAADARCQSAVNTMSGMDPTMPYIAGTGAEMTRMPVFFELDDEAERLTISRVLEMRDYPTWPEVVERGGQWFEGLPVDDPYTIFDVRALELRFGGWGGFLTYGYPDASKFVFYPFSDRRLLEALMSLPSSYRRDYGVVNDVITSQWPELLEIPFNDATSGLYGWYRSARRLAKRVLKR